jgi:hypothetical protein
MLGEGNRVALDFIIAEQGLHIVGLQVGSESLTLQGAAFSLKLDSSTVITWKSLQANSCSASGAWSGAVATTGSQKVTLVNAGSNIFRGQPCIDRHFADSRAIKATDGALHR